MKRVHAFTIIELLVVITILTLLVSLLLPAMSTARETVKIVACSNTERQQAIALRAYGTDNKQYVPPMVWWGYSANSVVFQEWTYTTATANPGYIPNQFQGGTSGFAELHNLGYMVDPKSFYCPADGTKRSVFATPSQWPDQISTMGGQGTLMGYLYTGGFNTLAPTLTDPWSSFLNGFNEANQTEYAAQGGVFMPFLLSRFDERPMDPQNGTVVRPGGQGVLVMDIAVSNGNQYYTGDTYPSYFSHNRNGMCTGINVAFEDGRVKWFKMDVTWTNQYQGMQNGPPYTICDAWHGDVWVSGPGSVKGLRY